MDTISEAFTADEQRVIVRVIGEWIADRNRLRPHEHTGMFHDMEVARNIADRVWLQGRTP